MQTLIRPTGGPLLVDNLQWPSLEGLNVVQVYMLLFLLGVLPARPPTE